MKKLIILCLFLAVYSATVSGQEAAFIKRTYVYKTVDGIDIQADVHRANDTVMRPIVVWFHGGALIFGSRAFASEDVIELCREEGYVLVSFDYRLAPEAKVPEIAEDVLDGMRWLHEQGPALFHVDTSRIVVAGNSAGGYLTLLTGLRMRPRPKALISYWGYGDIDETWVTKPSESHRTGITLFSRDEVISAVGERPITETSPDRPDVQGARIGYYLYLRQNGFWTREVTGFDPETQQDQIDPYVPVRNITPDYPPTLLIHGTADEDVPYEKSVAMAEAMAQQGVPHELIPVEGAGHELSPGDPDAVRAARARALAFIKQHLQ